MAVMPIRTTPFFTRHMLGAIEVDRDRRLLHPHRSRGARGRPALAAHPHLTAALAAPPPPRTAVRTPA
jgi:hypothetical protein